MTKRTGNKHSDLENSDKVQNPAEKQWEFMSQDQPQNQRPPRNRSFTPDTTNNIPNKLTAGDILSYGTMDQDTNTVVIPINMPVNQDANTNNVGLETREAGIPNTSLFPCNEPFNPHMRNESSRLQTFTDNMASWSPQLLATPQQLAKAGFLYLGSKDRVKCWYCNGRLNDWERDDNPWFEHAKWFPQCEFLLQQKGEKFVYQVSCEFPNLQRPRIHNPYHPFRRNMYDDVPPQIIETQRSPPILGQTTEQQKLIEKVDHEMETSHLVENAKLMGFEIDDIRLAVMRNFEENGESFPSFRSLVDAILDDNSASLLKEERIGSSSVADADLRSIASGGSGSQDQGAAHPSSVEVIRRLEDSRMCRMCHTVVADIVLMPCGHLVCCSNCCHIITKCPLCESEIQKAIKTYSA